jgi:hypothetical protein
LIKSDSRQDGYCRSGGPAPCPHSRNEGRRWPGLKKLMAMAPPMMMRVTLLIIGRNLIGIACGMAEFDSFRQFDAPRRFHRV